MSIGINISIIIKIFNIYISIEVSANFLNKIKFQNPRFKLLTRFQISRQFMKDLYSNFLFLQLIMKEYYEPEASA